MPSLWSRIKAKVAAARTAVVERYRAAKEAITTTTRTLSTLMPLRRILLVAFGVGTVVTLLGFAAPAGVAAVLAGIGGVVTAAVLCTDRAESLRRSVGLRRETGFCFSSQTTPITRHRHQCLPFRVGSLMRLDVCAVLSTITVDFNVWC